MNKSLLTSRIFWLLPVVVIALLLPEAALAGANAEFDAVVVQLTAWATGGLGKVVALSAVIVGAMFSVARSNPLPILSGLAFAMILNFAPGIVTGILSATL